MIDDITARFIEEHIDDDVRSLALQAGRYPGVDMHSAVTQIEARQTARTKLPTWAATKGVVYPPRISMEQCSSEATALYKSSLVAGERFADLTGGFGIDCSYMARNFSHATYIERNGELCSTARHNFALFGLQHIDVVNGNSEDILNTLPHQEWIFVDPARRDDVGRKVVALSDCEPDITKIEALLMSKCESAMIKCSPMLDITAACNALHYVTDVHIVAVNNECKELLFILSKEGREDVQMHCVNLQKEGRQQFVFSRGKDDVAAAYATEIKEFLYEPNAAIQKGGCHSAIAERYGVEKLHPNSHLYTSSEPVTEFPGRIFRVQGVSGFSKKEIKELLGDIKQANITVRNFPDSVQALRKRLKLNDGGDNYLFATTVDTDKKVLIRCSKI